MHIVAVTLVCLFAASVVLGAAAKKEAAKKEPAKKETTKKPAAAAKQEKDQAETEKEESATEKGAEGEKEEPPPSEAARDNPTVASLFADFLHFVKIGQFSIANNFAAALLKHAEATPVRLLELSEQHPDSIDVLTVVLSNSDVGANARRVLERVNEGRQIRRRDPERIKADIAALAGDPQQVLNATQRLQWSGEYAIPWMIAALQDPAQSALHPRIVKALPKVGLRAVTPLAISLAVRSDVIKMSVIDALGQLGYPHAIPYLKQVAEDAKTGQNIKQAAMAAIERIDGASGAGRKPAAILFLELATQYYSNEGAVRADPREEEANVWYWREDRLESDRVPLDIFDEIMAMRCCEESLRLQPDNADAQALWVAGNFRREAQLGVADVGSEQPDPACDKDTTRPKGYPRAIYFARSAGPRFNHMVLARALKDQDALVALGAITALAETAGESSLVGSEDVKQPLVEALSFRDSVVRIRAALALGQALPKTKFAGNEEVVPVLAGALALTGQRNVMVVDPDTTGLNRIMGILRDAGFNVVGQNTFGDALNRARDQLPVLEGCFLASDISEPDLRASLAQLRRLPAGKNLPVIVLAKERQMALTEEITRGDPGTGRVIASQDKARLLQEWDAVNRRVGRVELNADIASGLALAAAATLRLLGAGQSQVFDVGRAEGALLAALKHDSHDLRVLSGQVLATIPTETAQRGIAAQALDEGNKDNLRIAMFQSLAESARRHGNKLDEGQLSSLVKVVMAEKKLSIRTAASQAFGALNVPGNRASEIIRAQYRG